MYLAQLRREDRMRIWALWVLEERLERARAVPERK